MKFVVVVVLFFHLAISMMVFWLHVRFHGCDKLLLRLCIKGVSECAKE